MTCLNELGRLGYFAPDRGMHRWRTLIKKCERWILITCAVAISWVRYCIHREAASLQREAKEELRFS